MSANYYPATFRWRFCLWSAWNRLKRDAPVQSPARELHLYHRFVAQGKKLVALSGEELQKNVNFYGFSKPDIAWAIQESIRRVKSAKAIRAEGDKAKRERAESRSADISRERLKGDYTMMNREGARRSAKISKYGTAK